MSRKLTRFLLDIQETIFPRLEEGEGPLTKPLLRLVEILELVRIEEYVSLGCRMGRPSASRQKIARSFVAKVVLKIETTVMLVERLESDKKLRRICGWQSRLEVPSEATFSRAFSEFANRELPTVVHKALIEELLGDQIIGHLSRDATSISAREKPGKFKAEVRGNTPKTAQSAVPKKKGRPQKGEVRSVKEATVLEKQPLMDYDSLLKSFKTGCDVGVKRNSKGFKKTWIGYKLHLDVGDGDIPISALLSAASVHDSQVAIPLAEMSARRVTSLYDLADSAYDCPEIRKYSRALGHVEIIDHNKRRGEKIEFDPATALRYNQRSSVERVNSRIKDDFGGRSIRVRGHAKVLTHLMFGILALSAVQLLRLLT